MLGIIISPSSETANIVYNRTWETTSSTSGPFTIDNGAVTGYFLEPPAGSRISAGTYNVVPHDGPGLKWSGMMRLENVEGFSGILIHYGNYPSNTQGCLLPGSTRATDFVGGSRATTQAIFNYTGRRATITIYDPVYP